MVRKSDGSIRVCIDYYAVNERTVKDSYPLPRIDDLIEKLRDDVQSSLKRAKLEFQKVHMLLQ